jgi:hypothetical protein
VDFRILAALLAAATLVIYRALLPRTATLDARVPDFEHYIFPAAIAGNFWDGFSCHWVS